MCAAMQLKKDRNQAPMGETWQGCDELAIDVPQPMVFTKREYKYDESELLGATSLALGIGSLALSLAVLS